MRFRHRDGTLVHLAYCSNVHPAEQLDGVIGQLHTYANPIRKGLGVRRLGIGLWLAHDAALQLDGDEAELRRLRGELAATRCEVVTLNGFPYAGFHDPVVKHKVYKPDWTEPARREHTLRLARILTRLLPDDVDFGTISTLPFGWREPFDEEQDRMALEAFHGLAEDLKELTGTSGKRIAIAIEPEPGCRVEHTSQLADMLGGSDPDHLGACLDLCHLAVEFDDAATALERLDAAGVPVHKTQVSAGLRIKSPSSPVYRHAAEPFAESRFLHQTRERSADGTVLGVDDLHEALAGKLPGEGEWRIHFHFPLFHGGQDSTRAELEDSLATLVGGPDCRVRHLEVETYTWEVLPPGKRPSDEAGLAVGVAAELAWAERELIDLGLEPVDR